jgi:hypothetical protein
MKKYDLSEVDIYSPYGIVHCSVCVPKGMTKKQIEEAVNILNPTGTSTKWEIDENSFNDGSKNPHICESDKNKKHYLMVC